LFSPLRLEIGAHDIPHVHVIAGLQTVAVDEGGLPLQKPLAEDGDHARLSVGILPRTVHVRVPERGVLQPVLDTVVLKVEFYGNLRHPVGGNGPQRVLFVRGEIFLLAVPCAPGGGEDHLPDPVIPRRLEKNERTQDVLLRVEDRIGDGLAYVDLRRVVAEDLRPEGSDRLDGGFRSRVSEDEPRALGDVLLLPGGKVVQHEDLVTRIDERLSDMGGDESRSPGDQDPHRPSLRP